LIGRIAGCICVAAKTRYKVRYFLFRSSRPCSHIFPSLQQSEHDRSSAEKNSRHKKVRSTLCAVKLIHFLLLLLTSISYHFILTHIPPFSTHTFSITARQTWPETLRPVQHSSRGSLRGLLTRCIVTTGKHLLLYRQFIRNFFYTPTHTTTNPHYTPTTPYIQILLFTLFLDTIRATQHKKPEALQRPGRSRYPALHGCSVQRSQRHKQQPRQRQVRALLTLLLFIIATYIYLFVVFISA
jgi:hypothetical protein